MGAWNSKPWGNDKAADWFGNLFDNVEIRENVRKTLELDLDYNYDKIRAAASLLVFIGRTYVWPIEHIDDDLKLAIKRMGELKEVDVLQEDPDCIQEIQNEIDLLKCRLKQNDPPNTEEFKNWWISLAK